MHPARKLSLKRESLQELTTDELAGVAAGAQTKLECQLSIGDACWSNQSCMTYISCHWSDCNCPTINPACA